MSVRRFLFCATILFLCANGASAARYQRCQDGKTLVWNSLRGVAQESSWSGRRDSDGYATGEGTLTWYRLGSPVNSYTGQMVRGKFEGIVIKEQAGTRLQTKFVNGEKVGGWSEPGEAEAPSATPAAKEQKAKATPTAATKEESESEAEVSATITPTKRASPTLTPTPTATAKPTATPSPIVTPTPSPTPRPRPTATATPRPSTSITPTPSPILTPPPTATPAPTRRPTATPSYTRTPTAAPVETPTSPQVKALPASPSPTQQPTEGSLSLEHGISSPTREGLDLAAPQSPPRSVLPTAPWSEPPSLATPAGKTQDRQAPATSVAPTPAMHEFAGSKKEMIAEFKKETGGVLAQVKKATQNFRELEGIETVQTLPPEISESISALASQSREFRTKLGYEVAMYECGPETATSEALVAIDQALRDLNQKNAPAGRMKMLNFMKRYPIPAHDNQKPLWRYAASVLNACDRARKTAEQHLERARSLEASGNKSEALREYQEIYRIYPNAITTDKIQQLQNETH